MQFIGLGTTVSNTFTGRGKRRGFTLVELIVVLVIIAIIASIVVGSAIGYINKAKFDKNEANAISVYQAAQTAVTQMDTNGSIDGWIRSLIADGVMSDFAQSELDTLDASNESISKVVSLTYCSKQASDEGTALYDFLTGYFYDKSVFNSTISVEFVVNATYGVDRVSYSATVLSAFYSEENSPKSGNVWNNVCRGVGTQYESSDNLPARDTTYRFKKSHVGYYNGTEQSAKPQITSVFLPIASTYELDGHIAGPTVDHTAVATGFLFNLRNGETLDVVWSVFDSDGDLHDLALSDGQKLSISFWNPDADVSSGSTDTPLVTLTIDADTLENVSYNDNNARVTYEKCGNYLITRSSCDFLVTVTVKIGNGAAQQMNFPLTVSRISGDGRLGCPTKIVSGVEVPADYYSYSLSLDCMMVRADDSRSVNDRYSSARLFGNTPTNVIATIEGTCSYISGTNTEGDPLTGVRTIPRSFGTRAINDPAYLVDIKDVRFRTGMHTACVYDVKHSGITDDDNDTEDNNLSGMCRVNTLFGDVVYTKTTQTGSAVTVAGTVWNDTDGHDAVISSFRHLYNIRWMSSGNANYRIVRDLNWYVNGTDPSTDVRVFVSDKNTNKASLGYPTGVYFRSPVSNGQINVVSFPAIGVLREGQTLMAMSRANNGTPYSINGVQMRAASFTINDGGYGLICKNQGTICNVSTNNLNLVLSDVKDGIPCDYSFINNVDPTTGGSAANLNRRPTGGLVGLNTGTGVVGTSDTTIRMSNTVVLLGDYWQANTASITNRNDGVGAVIGLSDTTSNSINGVIQVDGNVAVLGRDNVGGAIGCVKNGLGAQIIVNGNPTTDVRSDFDLVRGNTDSDFVVVGCNNAGGAVGYADTVAFADVLSNKFTGISTPNADGDFSFTGSENYDYLIDVDLPEGSLIIRTAEDNADNYQNVGGAIAAMRNSSGDYLSIRVRNAGSIIMGVDKNQTTGGGVIGREVGCSVATTYIDVNNAEDSRIGTLSDAGNTGSVYTGGAYGYIDSNTASRTIAINAANNGTVISRGDDTGKGAGGAIGGTSANVNINFFIKIVNGEDSVITHSGTTASNVSGVGGAIGLMINANTSSITSSSVIYVENSGSISGKYNVGGAIGYASTNNGKIYSVNHDTCTITGVYDYIGGTVGRQIGAQSGTIQSVLDGAAVTGVNYVGGAAGRLQSFRDTGVVKTVVRSDSDVTGTTGSIVGGVCGDIRIEGTGAGGRIELAGENSAPVLTVKGESGNAIGGAVGILRANMDNAVTIVSADQSPTNRLIVHVKGINNVGGTVGILRSSSNNADNPRDLINNNSASYNINVSISSVLHPQSYISGTGSNVGGIVGYIESNGGTFGGSISLGSFFGDTSGAAYIRGERNVGGAVGHFGSSAPRKLNGNSGITVDLSQVRWTIEGTGSGDANIGGAVGFFDNKLNTDAHSDSGSDSNTFPITVDLGSTIVTSIGHNVGGAIGRNTLKNGIITVTTAGTVSGEYRVGGAIGYNQATLNEVEVTVLGSGIVRSTGTSVHKRPGETSNYTDPSRNGISVFEADVGGAIGCNWSDITTVKTTISGKVTGTETVGPNADGSASYLGDNVGGAIGFAYGCYNTNKFCKITTVRATIQGDARVIGEDSVGGAIGLNICNIGSVYSEITGTSRIVGNIRVGGAVGFASAIKNITGNNVLSGKGSGCIDSIVAVISSDKALQGSSRIGGAVGQVGNKWGTGDKYISAAVKFVKAELNSAYLFDPSTGTAVTEDASIGGVIGIFVDGRVSECVLGGTGGTVNTATSGIAYPCPSISSANTVIIAANGRSLGGIVGQIGLPGYQQNVCLSKISSTGSVRVCVVSMNGANKIGGWIGSGYAAHGGIGNNNKSEWNNTSTRVTYNIDNVMMVYTAGSEAGGFVGCIDQGNNGTNADINNNNPRAILCIINVNLSGSLISGSSSVGGVFGATTDFSYLRGGINITLSNHTNIGDYCDINGNYVTHNCYEAGGAVGSIVKNRYAPKITVPINVYADSTSRICADGTPSATGTYGVGGAFGRSACDVTLNYDGSSKWDEGVVRVLPVAGSTTPVYIYSSYSDVGGAVGVMISGNWTGTYTDHTQNGCVNAAVISRNANATASAGGFIGRMIDGKINYTSCEGSVSSYGYATGGFVGTMQTGTLEYCYSTALVDSTGTNTGGFVGNMTKGTIKNSYVGGHTFEGQYVVGEGNVSGADNVGGFAGAVTGAGTIENCYTTASVYGTTSNIGGFIGYAVNGCYVKSSYCTGLVSTDENAESVGIFAGSGRTDTFSNSNRAMPNINLVYGGPDVLIGTVSDPIDASKIGFMTYEYNADQSAVVCNLNNGTVYSGHPYDSALVNMKYPIKAFVNSEHYGDWPLPIVAGIPITADDVTIANNGEFDYTPGPLDLSGAITVTVNGRQLVLNEDYSVSYRGYTGAGYVTVVIAAKNGSPYSGTVTKTVRINAISIEDAAVALNTDSYSYTGAAILPDITVTLNGETLVYNTDYYLTYEHSDPALGNNNTDVGTIRIIVNGMGNYTGVALTSPSFDITSAVITRDGITLIGADQLTFTGDVVEPRVVVRQGGRTLSPTDYTLTYENNVHAGKDTAVVTITGTGSYTGTVSINFSIIRAINGWSTEPAIADWVWGETPSTPDAQATFGYDADPNYSYAFYEDEDCDRLISDISAVDAGSYYVKFWVDIDSIINETGYDDFTAPAERIVRFTILPADVSAATLSTVLPEPTFDGGAVYSGSSIRPSVTVTWSDGTVLTENTDYEIVWPSDTTSAGIKPFTINGIGNYTGSISGSYEIVLTHTVTYNTNGGTPAISSVTVRDGDSIAAAPDVDLVLAGYGFRGWYSDAELETPYTFGTPITSDITLYAKWVAVHTVTFVTGDGASTIDPVIVERGTTVTRPDDPTREGYEFAGWFYEEALTNQVDFDMRIYVNYTYYAKWNPIVTFDSMGGSQVAAQVITNGTATEPSVPVRDGFTFNGWYTDDSCTSLFDFTSTVASPVTLYAGWTEN